MIKTEKEIQELVDGIFRHELDNLRLALDGNRCLLEGSQDEQEKIILIKKISTLSQKIKNLEEEWGKYQKAGYKEWHVLPDILNENDIDSKIKINMPNSVAISTPVSKIIMSSLINNAIMHGGENVSRIDVWWRKTPKGIAVVCEDNGLGIPEIKKPHIFKKGFGDHTGLGLYLVKEILSKSGCDITENGTYGKGARFEIQIPDGAYKLY